MRRFHRHHPVEPIFDLDGVEERSGIAFRAFLRATHLNRQLLAHSLAKHGSYRGQPFYLHVLAQRDGATQRDLAEAFQVSRPTMCKILQRLEHSGLIARRPDTVDQRLVRVHLTEAGHALERQLRSVAVAHIGETIGQLSERDRDELTRLLGELNELMEKALAARPEATR